ncbi:polynucleotide adenylyltransferase PcnB [Desulfuromonas carbonis]|uniref:polynucleotide adenylyltransferase PcnB n=1 Tax=Desulfuromonas sp. DDH964 TaxID=1823759 RepID=UPI00078D5DA5|nr:polynucleotide adenylyltransferase PcnB [Desulfuromonas sp. DDH964]AMV71032.1 nucleic acid-independent polyadenylating polymerase [Desulfuromonas sp. DDH964]
MTPPHPLPGEETPPVILPRAEHSISRKQIDEETLKVLYRLARNGHKAYLVGGGVRDLLLGRTPKDFDVGTDATPNQVKKLFRNCFLVGRRFRLAHVRFGRDVVVEVATFRRQAQADDLPESPEDHFFFAENIFGTPRQDAFRRDFTINALFYDIETFAIIDYVGGLEDLRARRLRVIGDPLVRFTEDPVRMLRALEFAARLDFTLDSAAREAIYLRAPLIAEAAPARIREELMELFRHRVAGPVLASAQGLGLLPHLLAGYEGEEETFALLDRLDARTATGVPVDEPVALAVLFLTRFLRLCQGSAAEHMTEVVRLAGLILAPHCNYFHIAHGTRHQARELLVGFYRLSRGPGFRGERRFLQHPATPGALALFRLWTEASGSRSDLAERWQQLLEQAAAPVAAAAAGEKPAGRRRRRRSRGGRRRPPAGA